MRNVAVAADPTGSGVLLEYDNALYISRDWGLTVQQLNPPASVNTIASDPSHPGWIYAVASRQLLLSTDYGNTWTVKSSVPPSGSVLPQGELTIDPGNPNRLAAITIQGVITSADGGVTWTLPAASPVSLDDPFVFVSERCNPSGGILAAGTFLSGPRSEIAYS